MSIHTHDDRRYFVRYDVTLPARVRIGKPGVDKKNLKGATLYNISGGGAFIKSDAIKPMAPPAEIELDLPFDHQGILGAERLSMHLTGQIIRYEKNGFAIQFDEPRMGLE